MVEIVEVFSGWLATATEVRTVFANAELGAVLTDRRRKVSHAVITCWLRR